MLTLNYQQDLISQQKAFFATGKTKDINFRLAQLHQLKKTIINQKNEITSALKADLNKPELEAYIEIINCIREIDYALKNLKYWVQPKKVKADLTQFPSSALIIPEPLGIVLIIGPWNYPFSLIITPLIGAIASGNCAILKPSEIAGNTSTLVAKLIKQTFEPEFINVVEGGKEINQQLLTEKFDHIFFTGSTKIGKIVMEAAAKHLTPVTLELGGKSPCIVDTDINIEHTANRITWGKFMNAGQTCIAPDYLLVNSKIKQELISPIQDTIKNFYGDNPEISPDYARIINDNQYNRLVKLLEQGTIITGGETNHETRYIAPTLIENVSLESALMTEEIFGPILPIIEYQELTEAIAIINRLSKPLALYIFSSNKNKQQQILNNTSSGGVCLNDTIMHANLINLPFGGVGDSGIGRYHGKASFDSFSNYKSILKKRFYLDFQWRYPPYKDKLSLIKKLFKI